MTPVLPVHRLRYHIMTAELAPCDLISSGSREETAKAPADLECEGSVLSALGGAEKQQVSMAAATTTDTESGFFSGEDDLCVEHESKLDWFCGTERKVVCLHCTVVGPCQGHTVTPLADRVAVVRVSILPFLAPYSYYFINELISLSILSHLKHTYVNIKYTLLLWRHI